MNNLPEWLNIFTNVVFLFFLIATVLLLFSIVAALQVRKRSSQKEGDECNPFFVENFNETIEKQTEDVLRKILSDKEWKLYKKQLRCDAEKKSTQLKKRLFVMDFKGDIMATAVNQLRHQINVLLKVAKPHDEVVLRLESPGGAVHSYGLAAAQLIRLTDRQIPFTVCLDKVGASGGYMMACTANHIVAAPFAIVGSIGVIAQVPNVHRLLKKNDVDYLEITAGRYKRTLTSLGEITEAGKQKFTEQIMLTHELFQDFVKKRRPGVNLDVVATGEYWYGQQAKDLFLVDELCTSDEYILKKMEQNFLVYRIFNHTKQSFLNRILQQFSYLKQNKLRDNWSHIFLK